MYVNIVFFSEFLQIVSAAWNFHWIFHCGRWYGNSERRRKPSTTGLLSSFLFDSLYPFQFRNVFFLVFVRMRVCVCWLSKLTLAWLVGPLGHQAYSEVISYLFRSFVGCMHARREEAREQLTFLMFSFSHIWKCIRSFHQMIHYEFLMKRACLVNTTDRHKDSHSHVRFRSCHSLTPNHSCGVEFSATESKFV